MTGTTGRAEARTLLAALSQRLSAAAGMLLDPDVVASVPQSPPRSRAAGLLPHLVRLCADPARLDARWLVFTATFGAFPTADELKDFGRFVELARPEHAESGLLARVIADPARGRVDLPMTVVDGGVVVDVDFCARHDTHTGIHRVVRETVPRWTAAHDVVPAAWIDEYSAFRTLAPREEDRVLRFGTDTMPDPAVEAAYEPRLVVPWRSVVVLPDVPNAEAGAELASLARFSGNRLALIGYDMIPITSAEVRPASDAVGFAQYLTVVKHAHKVAGISRSAAAEFAGFAHAVAAQGLPGPVVREVQLAGEPPLAGARRSHTPSERPVLLCVGSREPHKNQRAALHAAERLWREGVELEVRLVGGPGFSDAVLRPAIDRILAAGYPLVDLGRVSDEVLTAEMTGADAVFFASLHEGYGLPVAEALACGTPVITSNFGSQLEIAEKGGCLVVDPRDDDDVTAAVRRLMTDRAERERLRAQAAARPVRTWDDYAADLWDFVTEESA